MRCWWDTKPPTLSLSHLEPPTHLLWIIFPYLPLACDFLAPHRLKLWIWPQGNRRPQWSKRWVCIWQCSSLLWTLGQRSSRQWQASQYHGNPCAACASPWCGRFVFWPRTSRVRCKSWLPSGQASDGGSAWEAWKEVTSWTHCLEKNMSVSHGSSCHFYARFVNKNASLVHFVNIPRCLCMKTYCMVWLFMCLVTATSSCPSKACTDVESCSCGSMAHIIYLYRHVAGTRSLAQMLVAPKQCLTSMLKQAPTVKSVEMKPLVCYKP